jgi:DNA polymerase-3 subunit alpha
MGVIVLDDGSAQLELMVFAELFDRRRPILKEDTLVFVNGRVRFDEFNQRLSVSADDVMDLAEARARAAARLQIDCDGGADVSRLKSLLQSYRVTNGASPTGCRVVLGFRNAGGCAELVLPEEWRVRPDETLVTDLRAQPRVRRVAFQYQ